MNIPKYLFRTCASIIPYKGQSAYGSVFGKEFETKINFQVKRTLSKGSDGDDRLSRAVAYLLPDVKLETQSKIVVDSIEYLIVEVNPVYGLNSLSHYELILQ